MTIPTEREPGPEPVTLGELAQLELCCLCRTSTPFWTKLPGRTPGEQVAICTGCAEATEPTAVPTKVEWLAAERALRTRKPGATPFHFLNKV